MMMMNVYEDLSVDAVLLMMLMMMHVCVWGFSQFFFTLGDGAGLERPKYTIFGKVVGDTVYNLLKANDYEVEGERPVYPPTIKGVTVIDNPFPDIEPRQLEKPEPKQQPQPAKQKRPKKRCEVMLVESASLLKWPMEC